MSHTLTYQSRPWYGSSKKGEYRLRRDDTNSDENELYQSCRRRSCHAPVRFYKSFEFLGNGWEYSAFRNKNWVYKIPAGIFPEVSDRAYLENSRSNYRMLVDQLGQEFVAESQFGDQCIQQQWLPNARPNRQRIIELSKRLLYLLANERWLPDVDLSLDSIAHPKNIRCDENGHPKIIDFTAYYDVFRLNYSREAKEIIGKGEKLLGVIAHG